MTEPVFSGRIPADRIHRPTLRPIDPTVLTVLGNLRDLTGAVSDALDQLGHLGAVPASTLVPRSPGARLIGRAITLRNVPRADDPHTVAQRGESRLADRDAHALAEPGDILVVQGVAGISSMGAVSAELGRARGELGAIVDGAVRDVDHARALGYAVWSSDVSPITGKYRLETAAINSVVHIAGVRVAPGDVVVADETGVCFIPSDKLEAFLAVLTAER